MSSPEKPKRNGPSARTPREFFQALFETISEELERNPDFAERLAARLQGPLQVDVRAKRVGAGAAQIPEALAAMDLRATREQLGEAELRARLSSHKNAELAAYIRARKLTDGAVSRRPKNSLINIIVRASR